ncbi:hypothetical protein IQ22_02660 [Pseudomonas duriflava]|uniref:Translation initiation factor IF-2 n=1 Tax=Pseudomonas duriflava TaxID=459528 RepID=A0A562Q9Q9_9PSED|nr:hypothetical protein [Pseudomonas duriflava]TWI53444.1 hypothetical protein IQ22_02660 [Pseudomonas duriflava]
MGTLRSTCRYKFCCLFVLLALSACDKPDEKPPEKPAEPAKAAVEHSNNDTKAVYPVLDATHPARPDDDSGQRDEPVLTSRVPETLEDKPKPASAPEKKPELVVEKPKPKPVPKTVPAKVPSPKEPPISVDLSLPEELVEQLDEIVEEKDESRLLPPLFSSEDDDNFNLNGRLLSRERSDDFEGAELQFQFKR